MHLLGWGRMVASMASRLGSDLTSPLVADLRHPQACHRWACDARAWQIDYLLPWIKVGRARVTFDTFVRDQRSAQFVNARLPLRLIHRPAIGAVLDRSRVAVGTVDGHALRDVRTGAT